MSDPVNILPFTVHMASTAQVWGSQQGSARACFTASCVMSCQGAHFQQVVHLKLFPPASRVLLGGPTLPSMSYSCKCTNASTDAGAGFVVCAYLVLACGFTVDEALSSFGKARPPGVRHEKFVDELRRRYEAPKGQEAAQSMRSPMGSLRSDMASVADFLDSGPGMEGLADR